MLGGSIGGQGRGPGGRPAPGRHAHAYHTGKLAGHFARAPTPPDPLDSVAVGQVPGSRVVCTVRTFETRTQRGGDASLPMLVGMIDEDEFDEGARRVRGGVAVVSVWFERDDPAAIPRARITTAIGTQTGRVSRTAAGDEEILRVVRVWLAQLRGRSNDAATLAGRIGDADATGDADRQ